MHVIFYFLVVIFLHAVFPLNGAFNNQMVCRLLWDYYLFISTKN